LPVMCLWKGSTRLEMNCTGLESGTRGVSFNSGPDRGTYTTTDSLCIGIHTSLRIENNQGDLLYMNVFHFHITCGRDCI
jgi:hypothetical protein